MKKLLLILVGILFLTGCSEPIELDLEEVESRVDALTTDVFSIQSINYEDMIEYDEMSFVYDYDFQTVFGLDSNLVEEYNVMFNEETKQLLAIFKPVEDKEEEFKTQFSAFTDTLYNVSNAEHQGYLIYVLSKNNDSVIEQIRKVKEPLFPPMSKVEIESLELIIGLTTEEVDEILMKTPMLMTNAATYIIVKPSEGNEEAVEEKLDQYMSDLEENWKTYLPEQYELVKDRMKEELGEYLIYIVSDDNEKVLEAIKN